MRETGIYAHPSQIAHKLEGQQSFPRGACGNASVLQGEWLGRKGFKGVEYVAGRSDEINSHAWLVCDGLIIDITADQFDMGMPPVFVLRAVEGAMRTGYSNFHARFEIQTRHSCVMDGAYDQANYAALVKVIDGLR
ncbi:hypothetical protein OYT1_ch1387 [Ferriphaselus amnicola]|uniref:Uncharacterized protein n=1 Tax=Ferriphaselus amnicola TaxID=1188319 RepID=A0A2Z6GBV1_9PROT|nr:hypothetical protein [Ferriphaselus amnicola]BBE50944.1 hypothetical protein OYT1_ch1387 [Ferriphaselus amnicola]